MVIEPFVSRVDGHPNLTVSEEDMNFISIARDAMPRLIEEVRRLRRVIFTGGAMYRMERAAMGIPGGNDEPVKIQEAFEKICPSCGHRYGDHIIPTFPKSGLECPHAGVPV